MVARIVRTSYGRGATIALAEAIDDARRGDPLTPVTVVVSDHGLGISLRRLLANGVRGGVTSPGLAAVDIATLLDLARALSSGAPELEGRRPLSDAVVQAAARRILATRPGAFGPVSDHPSLERSIVAAHRDLAEVPSGALDRLAARSPLASELVSIHRALASDLVAGFHDERERADLASRRVGSGDAQTPPLVVHLPARLRPSERRLLQALANSGQVTIVCGHAVTPSGHSPGDPAEDLADLFGIDLPPAPTPGRMVERLIVSVTDQEEEARVAVRQVVEAAREGMRLDRMAIVHPPTGDYARLLHERLAASDIESNGASVRRLDETTVGRFLLGVLAWPDRGLRRVDFEAVMATAPLWDPDHQRVPDSAWGRLARRAGVSSGIDDWIDRLERLATEFDTQGNEESRLEARPWLMDRLARDSDLCRRLSALVVRLHDDLEAIAAARTWKARGRLTATLVRRYLGSDAVRTDWPADDLLAVESVAAVIDRLGDLDDVEPGAPYTSFRRALASECHSPLRREGRVGRGVLVAGVDQAPGLDVDLVVVLGLAEGSMPTRRAGDPLLPDADRIGAGTGLPVRHDHAERQHLGFLAALAAASRRVVLVHPRGDLRRSGERPPSRWLLAEIEAMSGQRPDPEKMAELDEPWYRHLASFSDALAHDAPSTPQEYELGLMVRGGDADGTGLRSVDPVFDRGMELVGARMSPTLTRFDGNLAGVSLPPLDSGEISPTRLEKWVACPFAYFAEYVLGVRVPDEPDDDLHLSPLVRGTIIHRSLERLVVDGLAAGDLPVAGAPWEATHLDYLIGLLGEECDRAEARGEAAHPLFWPVIRRRIAAELADFLILDSAARAADGTRPVAAEYRFGGDTAPEIVLADGRTLRFRGAIDRVDQADDGRLVVIDAKTGRPDRFSKISGDRPFPQGTHLQLPIYGLAAAQLGHGPATEAWFAFVGAGGSHHRHGYRFSPSISSTFSKLLESIVTGIESGVFPHHPPASTRFGSFHCPHCVPDGIDARRLHAACERKADDPAMAHHRNHLVEPVPGDPADMADDADSGDGTDGTTTP